MDRPILSLALPSVAASLSVPVIGIADTILVGHLPDVAAMGAVSVAGVIFDVLYWGLGFFRMGTTGLVAQYYGGGDVRATTRVLHQSLLAAGAIGLVLMMSGGLMGELGFDGAGPEAAVRTAGQRYLEIRILGAPFVLLTYVLTGFFRGMADAMSPLWVTLLVNVVNVVGDYALIYGALGAPALGVEGAAWASVAAAGSGAGLAVAIVALRYWGRLAKRPGWGDWAALRRLVTVNLSLFGRTACLLVAQFTMVALVSRMGAEALAANAVVWQVWSLVSYSVDGFAHAAETLVGNALGASDFTKARALARRCMGWGTILGLGYTVVFVLGIGPIARAFTHHQQVVVGVVALMPLLAFIQPLNSAVFILDGILIGANDGPYLFGAMAVSSLVVFLPAALGSVYLLDGGLAGAWAAYNALMGARFLTLYHRYRGSGWIRSIVDSPGALRPEQNA